MFLNGWVMPGEFKTQKSFLSKLVGVRILCFWDFSLIFCASIGNRIAKNWPLQEGSIPSTGGGDFNAGDEPMTRSLKKTSLNAGQNLNAKLKFYGFLGMIVLYMHIKAINVRCRRKFCSFREWPESSWGGVEYLRGLTKIFGAERRGHKKIAPKAPKLREKLLKIPPKPGE